MNKWEVSYEVKIRFLIAFLAFLIGMTIGWLTGETGLNRWWIFGVDIVFFGTMVYLAVKVWIKDIYDQSSKGK